MWISGNVLGTMLVILAITYYVLHIDHSVCYFSECQANHEVTYYVR